MASNEIEIFGELSTGSLLPGGRAGLRIKRTWESRQESFVKEILDRSGASPEQLEHSITDNEQLADLYLGALERTVRTGDDFYREALARLVAGAVDGSTPIDVAEAVADRILRLDVASLRFLYDIYRQHIDPLIPDALTYETSVSAVLSRCPADRRDLIDPAKAQLEAAGFIEREVHVTTTSAYGQDAESEVETVFQRTPWGARAYQLCQLHENHAG